MICCAQATARRSCASTTWATSTLPRTLESSSASRSSSSCASLWSCTSSTPGGAEEAGAYVIMTSVCSVYSVTVLGLVGEPIKIC